MASRELSPGQADIDAAPATAGEKPATARGLPAPARALRPGAALHRPEPVSYRPWPILPWPWPAPHRPEPSLCRPGLHFAGPGPLIAGRRPRFSGLRRRTQATAGASPASAADDVHRAAIAALMQRRLSQGPAVVGDTSPTCLRQIGQLFLPARQPDGLHESPGPKLRTCRHLPPELSQTRFMSPPGIGHSIEDCHLSRHVSRRISARRPHLLSFRHASLLQLHFGLDT